MAGGATASLSVESAGPRAGLRAGLRAGPRDAVNMANWRALL